MQETLKDKVYRNWRSIYIVFAIAADIVSMSLCIVIVVTVRGWLPNIPQVARGELYLLGSYYCAIIFITAAMVGTYRAAFHSNVSKQYLLMGKSYLFSALIILSLLTFLGDSSFPKRFTLLFLVFVPVSLIAVRIVLFRFNKFMQKKGFGRHNSLLVGYDGAEMNIVHRFQSFPELGYDLKGIITKYNLLTPMEIHGKMVPRYSLSQIEDVILQHQIDRVFIPSSVVTANGYQPILAICKNQRVKLKILSRESDQLLHLAKVLDIAGITLHTTERLHIEKLHRITKRFFDVVVAGSVLLILSPILLLTALAIAIESGRPVLFKQKRAATKNGKVFDFYKYRSMIVNADELKDSLFEQNESSGALFKMKDDPRLTRVGKFIRKFSIDELPQLVNVLKGDMSIVGPRPLPVEDFERYEETPQFWELIKERERTKPGITGLWQVSGRSGIGFADMIWLDLYYAENQSLLFDLEILFSTIPVVLFGKGAY